MRDAPGDGYREIADWPRLAGKREPGQLALLAVNWIAMNRGFIQARVQAEAGFDHREVVSQLMFRAYRGGGMTLVLQAHVDGTAPIANPRGLLLQYVYWAAGEIRQSAWPRRESTTDWADTAAPATIDPDGNPSGYLELISVLSAECRDAIAGECQCDMRHDQLHAAEHVSKRLPDLWEVFRRYAPEVVSAEVAALDDDSRACVLLAIFPAKLPHSAVTAYRQLAMVGGCGAVTVAATQRKISRLRAHLQKVWPPELLPHRIKTAGMPSDGDTETEEVP